VSDEQRYIEIPLERLSATALRRLVEEFVTRDGTDYGLAEATLDRRVEDVLRRLHRREAKIVFDDETGSVNIVPTERQR
jgi:hypothetical protein